MPAVGKHTATVMRKTVDARAVDRDSRRGSVMRSHKARMGPRATLGSQYGKHSCHPAPTPNITRNSARCPVIFDPPPIPPNGQTHFQLVWLPVYRASIPVHLVVASISGAPNIHMCIALMKPRRSNSERTSCKPGGKGLDLLLASIMPPI
ncbi:hypothetical protein EJ04DRAFT_264186 [Polyplosphaeria fusca]|uniref:Uncharacterized protein n=1 Tax=Polyplosphaeria fusca TaxID=682080 RepID=A0A9P4RB49_9PLEO|nr:hypothetical protein EJ04DRAFT_264186 [Polyplosphaeria fusca]